MPMLELQSQALPETPQVFHLLYDSCWEGWGKIEVQVAHNHPHWSRYDWGMPTHNSGWTWHPFQIKGQIAHFLLGQLATASDCSRGVSKTWQCHLHQPQDHKLSNIMLGLILTYLSNPTSSLHQPHPNPWCLSTANLIRWAGHLLVQLPYGFKGL